MTINELKAKEAIKEVFNNYLLILDNRAYDKLDQIFVPEAQMVVYFGDKKMFDITGVDNMEKLLKPAAEKTISQYHIGGQVLVTLHGENEASSIGYSKAAHTINEDGKDYIEEYSAKSEDTFVLKDGKWMITKRIMHTVIIEKRELKGI